MSGSTPTSALTRRRRRRRARQVDGMAPAHARALYAAGLVSPELVGLADEQAVADALAAGAPRRAPPKGAKGCALRGVVCGLRACSCLGVRAPRRAAGLCEGAVR